MARGSRTVEAGRHPTGGRETSGILDEFLTLIYILTIYCIYRLYIQLTIYTIEYIQLTIYTIDYIQLTIYTIDYIQLTIYN